MSIDQALEALRAGSFVLVHDAPDRENEVDMVIAAEAVEPHHVATMRCDAGGLICVALHQRIAENFGLPFMTEIYGVAFSQYNVLAMTKPNDLPYDERSAFSISVNHRRTFTGVTDIDRALTIRELGKLGARALDGRLVEEFGRNFRSPGHVPLLRAADGLVLKRQGQTELSIALAEMADIVPVMVTCEMLDAQSNRALSWQDAVKYAKSNGLTCLSGVDIVQAYTKRGKTR